MRIFPEPSVRSIGLMVVRVTLIAYVVYGALLILRQDALLYFPDQTPFQDCAWLADASQINAAGTRAYFFKNGTSTKLAVLYHGNAGRACDRSYYRTALEHAGYSWLFVEYSGYAGDGNKANTASVLRDVEHIVSWTEGQKFASVAVVGESIGAGPASYHASLSSVEKLILVTPFIDIASVGKVFLPVYPIRLMLRDDFDNGAWAAHAKRVLIIHGTADTIIPFSLGKALFDVLPQEQKELLVLPGTDHNDAPALFESQNAIMKFLQEE